MGARYCPLIPSGSPVPHIYYASERRRLSFFVVTRDLRFEDG